MNPTDHFLQLCILHISTNPHSNAATWGSSDFPHDPTYDISYSNNKVNIEIENSRSGIKDKKKAEQINNLSKETDIFVPESCIQ